MADKSEGKGWGTEWKEVQAGRYEQFKDDLGRGVSRAVTDIRQKVVEEPWFGRAVTKQQGDGRPNTIYSYKHDNSVHYDMSVNTNNSRTFNGPVNYGGKAPWGEHTPEKGSEKDIHGNGPEKGSGVDIHGNGPGRGIQGGDSPCSPEYRKFLDDTYGKQLKEPEGKDHERGHDMDR